jgi:exodeoxyribonuclease V alpha subunit
MDFKLTEQQEKAIKMVFENKISILTGGAGCGKTTVIKNIIEKAIDLKMVIKQAAPTGKAAKRMIEATGVFSSTIHSLLGCDFDKNGDFVFLANEHNFICADLIILDEISMIDNDLMYSFLKAIDPQKTRLLLVGDSGQLPSVGAGAILRDIITSKKFPHIELNIIHRNSGKIVEACSKVRNSELYKPCLPSDLNLNSDNPINLIHIQTNTAESSLQAVSGIVNRMIKRGFNPNTDIQVISPVNRRGLLSCDNINILLKEQLNPAIYQEADNTKFRINDKVINIKNQRIKDVDNKDTLIVNGDIGFIKEINKNIIVKFSEPERLVAMPKNSNKLLGAYCITCHRFQGSQAPVIIIPIDSSATFFTSSKWLYTALSRAETLCITIGNFNDIGKILNNKKNIKRKTMLQEQINFNYKIIQEFEAI